MCDFSGETFQGFEVLSFSVSVTMTQRRVSADCLMTLYPLKVHLQVFLSIVEE